MNEHLTVPHNLNIATINKSHKPWNTTECPIIVNWLNNWLSKATGRGCGKAHHEFASCTEHWSDSTGWWIPSQEESNFHIVNDTHVQSTSPLPYCCSPESTVTSAAKRPACRWYSTSLSDGSQSQESYKINQKIPISGRPEDFRTVSVQLNSAKYIWS